MAYAINKGAVMEHDGVRKGGECLFPNGEPSKPNWAARNRVQDLTIYDSQNDHGIWIEREQPTTIRLSMLPGAIFCLIALIGLLVTWSLL